MATKKPNPMIAVVNNYIRRDGTYISAAVRDILTDLMHLCEAKKINFEDRVRSAREVFVQE